ncbi:MAG: GNAT family N-acetyltransferase [Planctomycetota bacterium]
MTQWLARECQVSEWRDALQLLYQHLSPRERSVHINALIRGEKGQNVPLEGLLGCWLGEKMVGSMLAMNSAGRTVVAWPPRFDKNLSEVDLPIVRQSLIQALRSFSSCRRARIVQVLLGDEENYEAPALCEEGFFHLAHLIYLRRDLRARIGPPSNENIEYVHYSPALHDDFLSVLERSYAESLDCPRLTGLRAMEDIYESHRAQGQFDPQHWFLARKNGKWAGCLLLSGLPEYRATEVAYLGVLPESRGQGLGRELTRKALRVARKAGSEQVTLAVDEGNAPARGLYAAEGFKEWDHRDAYLLVLDSASGSTRSSGTEETYQSSEE